MLKYISEKSMDKVPMTAGGEKALRTEVDHLK
ncbi:MAG: hypothetical protein ACI9OF_000547, partial [Saprospiraceae bacterium]